MKSVTIDIADSDLDAIEEYARRNRRETTDVMREAIEEWRRRRVPIGRVSVLDIPARSVGKILRPLDPDDDLLGEMLSEES